MDIRKLVYERASTIYSRWKGLKRQSKQYSCIDKLTFKLTFPNKKRTLCLLCSFPGFFAWWNDLSDELKAAVIGGPILLLLILIGICCCCCACCRACCCPSSPPSGGGMVIVQPVQPAVLATGVNISVPMRRLVEEAWRICHFFSVFVTFYPL